MSGSIPAINVPKECIPSSKYLLFIYYLHLTFGTIWNLFQETGFPVLILLIVLLQTKTISKIILVLKNILLPRQPLVTAINPKLNFIRCWVWKELSSHLLYFILTITSFPYFAEKSNTTPFIGVQRKRVLNHVKN